MEDEEPLSWPVLPKALMVSGGHPSLSKYQELWQQGSGRGLLLPVVGRPDPNNLQQVTHEYQEMGWKASKELKQRNK